ncbi:hypothetical protein LJC56_07990 [Christensenellaceae bacterium OttesenSCG-928-K19]|nr:hypothetical protein [Christensenellaceae bacterium OttesenSCG-928-K19]
MMYSDYFALFSCAFSVLFTPFLIVSQLRFSHIMQNAGYDTKRYFGWIKNNLPLVFLPLAGITIIVLMTEPMLAAYLDRSAVYELHTKVQYMVIYGYLIGVAAVAGSVAWIFYRYNRFIKMETMGSPLVCTGCLVNLFLLSSVMLCAVITLQCMFISLRHIVFYLPLLAPFFVPLANVMLRQPKVETEKA